MPEHKALEWSETERALLDRILDQIIPASVDARIPSAGSLGVARFLATMVGTEPGLEALFQRGLACATALVNARGSELSGLGADDQRTIVEQLEEREPEFFEALLRHTYMGYYTDPNVPPLFGLSTRPPQPDGYEVPKDDPEELAALVEPVKNRGSCYRKC